VRKFLNPNPLNEQNIYSTRWRIAKNLFGEKNDKNQKSENKAFDFFFIRENVPEAIKRKTSTEIRKL